MKEEVIGKEDCNSSSAALDGILISSYPNCAGRANSVYFEVTCGSFPVSAGSRYDLSISSRGEGSSPLYNCTYSVPHGLVL